MCVCVRVPKSQLQTVLTTLVVFSCVCMSSTKTCVRYLLFLWEWEGGGGGGTYIQDKCIRQSKTYPTSVFSITENSHVYNFVFKNAIVLFSFFLFYHTLNTMGEGKMTVCIFVNIKLFVNPIS